MQFKTDTGVWLNYEKETAVWEPQRNDLDGVEFKSSKNGWPLDVSGEPMTGTRYPEFKDLVEYEREHGGLMGRDEGMSR